tara:strand:+ start:162 stop:353 length:192 start_codon:yes stop_codon:yes gene_type:complete
MPNKRNTAARTSLKHLLDNNVHGIVTNMDAHGITRDDVLNFFDMYPNYFFHKGNYYKGDYLIK